jgi:hypothetical protein
MGMVNHARIDEVAELGIGWAPFSRARRDRSLIR